MPLTSLLIADDDLLNLEAMRLLLKKEGFDVVTASSGDEAIRIVSNNPRRFGVVVLDYRMDGKNGAETAREIRGISPDAFILIHSGDDSREALQAAWEAGVLKFIEKSRGADYFLEQIKEWVARYVKEILPTLPTPNHGENESLIQSIGMIGRSASLAALARRIHKYQEEHADLNVLILGENGSGKELIARALHQFSQRNRHPFIAIDAGALTENLAESELFGHEKGAFTGADQKRMGAFQSADRGTLFLDEIGNTSPMVQAKLLRAIENRKIRPVGTSREIPVNVRIVTATNLDLKTAIREGKFREDLYYRLRGITLAIPPLRERPEDIEPIVNHVCDTYNQTHPKKKSFSPRALRGLESYSWPGNIRELNNTVMQLLTESYSEVIQPAEVAEILPSTSSGSSPAATTDLPLKSYVDEVTRNYVLNLLKSSRSKLEAAKKAGMAESTFRDLLKRLNLLNDAALED